MKELAATCLLLLSLWSCSSTLPERNQKAVPKWLLRLPVEQGKLYAVGVSGPTYFREDEVKKAIDNAKSELAKALGGRIQSLYLEIRKGNQGSQSEMSVVTATSWATDMVVEHSQILEVWVDEAGNAPNSRPGMAYALAVIDLRYASDTLGRTQKKPR